MAKLALFLLLPSLCDISWYIDKCIAADIDHAAQAAVQLIG